MVSSTPTSAGGSATAGAASSTSSKAEGALVGRYIGGSGSIWVGLGVGRYFDCGADVFFAVNLEFRCLRAVDILRWNSQ